MTNPFDDMGRARHGGGNGKAKVRYAVVGLGHIAQTAVLPAFEHAGNAVLAALVSDDPVKRKELSKRHAVEIAVDYDEYDQLLASGTVDAVYIALPNHLHADYTVRAARAGVHVLCEKPMAVTEMECEKMIRACEDADVRLMIAYRLHFEAANLEAIEVVTRGDLGRVKLFDSVFSQNVEAGDVRLMPIAMGGGTVYDIGIYCINAARYLFRAEPIEVTAFCSTRRGDERFRDCDEETSAVLRFPEGRLASFTTCFSGANVSSYRVVGERGWLRMDPAYDYAGELGYDIEIDGQRKHRTFEPRDQFAPELVYFSECVLEGREPEPNGLEGLADVHIIRSIYESAKKGKRVKVLPVSRHVRPTKDQRIDIPPVDEPNPVRASEPSKR